MEDDMNGSAKVALISINRSLAAWSTLLKIMDEYKKPIMEIIVLLRKIKSVAENEFPKAMAFIRPGLDET
jgi:hypothetical protein